MLLTLVALATLPASSAAAQVTLVVRTTADPHPSVETAVEDGLRDSVGGSVRRVASPLDELALAAGCSSDEGATSAACVATIAQAAGARLVAIEHLARDGAEWRVSIDLRRADGTQVSVLTALCDDAGCVAEAMADADTDAGADATEETADTHYSDAHTPLDEHRAPSAVAPATSTSAPATASDVPQPGASRSIAILPHALFIGATVLGIGSFVAAGVAIATANEASALGQLRNMAQVDRERALEEQNAIALGVGIALATCGAALAIAGAFTLGDDGPRLRVGLGHADLSVSF